MEAVLAGIWWSFQCGLEAGIGIISRFPCEGAGGSFQIRARRQGKGMKQNIKNIPAIDRNLRVLTKGGGLSRRSVGIFA